MMKCDVCDNPTADIVKRVMEKGVPIEYSLSSLMHKPNVRENCTSERCSAALSRMIEVMKLQEVTEQSKNKNKKTVNINKTYKAK